MLKDMHDLIVKQVGHYHVLLSRRAIDNDEIIKV